jgi:hypothetical protein
LDSQKLGAALTRHARAEAGHHLMMIADFPRMMDAMAKAIGVDQMLPVSALDSR